MYPSTAWERINQPPTRRRVTVQETAEVLGVTVEAVRGRIKRRKLEAERDKDGSVYVWIDTDQPTTRQDQPETGNDQITAGHRPDRLGNQEQLVESLLDQVTYMREQLAAEREANRENRRLLAAALERIPAIESPETLQAPETVAGDPEGTREPRRTLQAVRRPQSTGPGGVDYSASSRCRLFPTLATCSIRPAAYQQKKTPRCCVKCS